MKSDDLDLNLLPYFNQLMRERKVSKVAESLGVSQPAVSNALKRLRGAMGDDLFLRTTHGMEPTVRARQLAEPIAYAIDTIKSAMSQQVAFDPSVAQRNFLLGLSDLGDMYFLPPLLSRIGEQASGVVVTAVHNNPLTLKDDMETGRVEVSIGISPQLQGSFFRQRLFREHYLCVFRKGHPLEGRRTTLADYKACEHVVVAAGNDLGEVDRLMERKGIERRIRAIVPHAGAIGQILRTTNLVATLPSRMVQILAEPLGLCHSAHPVSLPDMSISMYWHAVLHRDPANQWFRRTVFELFSESPAINA
ncbi:MAG: LysR family transcriptional regulator [Panacagrimonas sp.]